MTLAEYSDTIKEIRLLLISSMQRYKNIDRKCIDSLDYFVKNYYMNYFDISHIYRISPSVTEGGYCYIQFCYPVDYTQTSTFSLILMFKKYSVEISRFTLSDYNDRIVYDMHHESKNMINKYFQCILLDLKLSGVDDAIYHYT